MFRSTFLKELMLIKQVHRKSHYWYFLHYSFKFHPNVCNRCHDLLMMSIYLSDIGILNIKGSDYCCIISLISKNEAVNLMQNVNNLSLYIKMGKDILTFGNFEIKKKKFTTI